MTRYISDRDIEALAQSGDQYDGFDDTPDEPGLTVSFPVMAGITAGVVAAIVVAWVAVDRLSGPGTVPLVTASTDPIKVRPETPGGRDIPFQDMALYDRLEPSQAASEPVLAPLPEQPDRAALEPVSPILQDGEVLQAQAPAAEPVAPPPPQPTVFPVTPAQSLADGEGESLFSSLQPNVEQLAATPVEETPVQEVLTDVTEEVTEIVEAVEQAPEISVPSVPTPIEVTTTVTPAVTSQVPAQPLDGPPIPARHPTRGAVTVATAPQTNGVESFFPTAGDDDDQRRIRRGTIASQQVPLDAVQGGLRPGGALGATDENGNLVYRNSLRQETTAPLPSGPVEGEVQLVLQPPAGQASNVPPALQPPAISVTPQRPTRSADGAIEIRSPNREAIEIRSPSQVAGAAPAVEPPPTPSLIPQPPSRPVGPASADQLADGDQLAAANQAPPPAPIRRPLSEVNNLPSAARAPAPISTGITRGSVVNQRAPAPGAPQAPVTEPQATQQTVAAPASNLQPTSVSSIPPRLSAQEPAPVPTQSTGEGWRVQLASVGSQEAAMGEWRRFQRANSDLLGNLNLKIQRADLGARGIFYRIQAGVLDRDGANRVCQALKSRGTDCLITRD